MKWARDIGTAWYRSQESVPTHPHFVGDGYLSNKKWPLIEESSFFLCLFRTAFSLLRVSKSQLCPVRPGKAKEGSVLGKAQSRTRRDDVKERHRNANKDRSAFAAEAFKTGFSILEFLQYN